MRSLCIFGVGKLVVIHLPDWPEYDADRHDSSYAKAILVRGVVVSHSISAHEKQGPTFKNKSNRGTGP